MAKSTRSKSKRSFRAKKRETGIYAATEAARLQRLSAKISALATKDKEDVPFLDVEGEQLPEGDVVGGATVQPESVDLEGDATSLGTSKRISTHGPRCSRREEWRASKGLDPLPKRRGMNRQGGIAARRKPGRSSRRR